MPELKLQNVTLCAASDVAIPATIGAMERCRNHVEFHDSILFSSILQGIGGNSGIRHVRIPPLRDRADYSRFILVDLARHIETDFVLVAQWDGFVIDPSAWQPEFLDFDYIGAPWVGCPSDRSVGNGGFSLRSKRLLEAGTEDWFQISHPEDLAICHRNRAALDSRGFVIADHETARQFSREREPFTCAHFGVHGVFTLAEIMNDIEFDEFLREVEDGVIGRRELLDIIRILKRKSTKRKLTLRRCALEFIQRYPFNLNSISAFRFLF